MAQQFIPETKKGVSYLREVNPYEDDLLYELIDDRFNHFERDTLRYPCIGFEPDPKRVYELGKDFEIVYRVLNDYSGYSVYLTKMGYVGEEACVRLITEGKEAQPEINIEKLERFDELNKACKTCLDCAYHMPFETAIVCGVHLCTFSKNSLCEEFATPEQRKAELKAKYEKLLNKPI
jgi:hypothetical protein